MQQPEAPAPLPATSTPAAGLGACEQQLRDAGATAGQLAKALPGLKNLGPAENLRCWSHATPAGPVAAVQGGNEVAQVALVDADGRTTVVGGRANPDAEVQTQRWLCTPWTSLPVGAAPPSPFADEYLLPGMWWRQLPFVEGAGGSITVHVAHDSDFCRGFKIFQAQSGRWREVPGGGEGCLIGAHHLVGISDLDGDGHPERIETAALADFAGDGDQPTVPTLRAVDPAAAVNWQDPAVTAFFWRLWAGEPTGEPDPADRNMPAEPDLDVEAGELSDCLERLPELAAHLHAATLAQFSPTSLRNYAESQLGRVGKGTCWSCRTSRDSSSFDLKQCRSSVRAIRCLIESGKTGHDALASCWHGPI